MPIKSFIAPNQEDYYSLTSLEPLPAAVNLIIRMINVHFIIAVMKSRQNAPHVTVIPIITNEDLIAAKANNSDCKNPPPNPDDMKSV